MGFTAQDIVSLRAKLGLTQEAFSNGVGVNRSTVAMWEIGAKKPRPTTQERIRNFVTKLSHNKITVDLDDEIIVEVPLLDNTRDLDNKVISQLNDLANKVIAEKWGGQKWLVCSSTYAVLAKGNEHIAVNKILRGSSIDEVMQSQKEWVSKYTEDSGRIIS